MGILDIDIVRRIRRNHAIEHATIHLLTPRYGDVALAGRADSDGFYLYGPVTTEDVQTTVIAALEKLKQHPELAVHPRCGTNLVVSGLVGGIASVLALATLSEERRRSTLLDVLPRLMLAGTAAAIASQSFGPLVQERCTTLAQVDGVTLRDVKLVQRGRHTVHRVRLAA